MNKPDISVVPIDSIRPNPKCLRPVSELHVKYLAEQINREGLNHPIRVRKKYNEIHDGVHRWHACKQLGYTVIKVEFMEYLEDVANRVLVCYKTGQQPAEADVRRLCNNAKRR